MNSPEILCIGLVNVNVMLCPVDEGIFQRDATLIGEIPPIPGGDALNEAVIMARLGVKSGLVGKLGRDMYGGYVVKGLEQAGVDTSFLLQREDGKTGVCAVLVKPGGSRTFAVFRGDNETLCREDLDVSMLEGVKILSIGSMFALKSLDGAGTVSLLGEARRRGVTTCADMKSDAYGVGPKILEPIYPLLDYFLPSYDEAFYLTGETRPEKMASLFREWGCGCTVIKLGKEGCYVSAPDFTGILPPYDVPVADTTGAGDNFVAGFLAGILKGWGTRRAAMFGNGAASLSVGVLGATTGVKSLEQVWALLDREEPEWNFGKVGKW